MWLDGLIEGDLNEVCDRSACRTKPRRSRFRGRGCLLSRSLTIRFAELFGDLAVAASPELYEPRQREREQRATYDALLTAGVPDQLACATAFNPQVLQAIAPTYLGIRADAASPPAAATCGTAAPKDVVATVAAKLASVCRRVIEHKWLMATSLS